MDNSKAAAKNGRPVFKVNKFFSIKMGWFTHDQHGLIPGHNLTPIYRDDRSPSIRNPDLAPFADLKDDTSGEPLLWKESDDDITGQDVRLSVWCDWHFHTLNESFQKLLPSEPNHELSHVDFWRQTLFVYCDAVESSFVGNQQQELPREITLEGTLPHYIEPRHIHYIPVRSTVIDIVRFYLKLSGTESGSFGEFDRGEVIATLHFRRIWLKTTIFT